MPSNSSLILTCHRADDRTTVAAFLGSNREKTNEIDVGSTYRATRYLRNDAAGRRVRRRAQIDPALKPDEARAIAQDAWVFGMPLVYIEMQIDALTHVPKPQGAFAPINQFAHYREFPDASNKTVVGFNVDTLYSLAQLDLAQGADGPVGPGDGQSLLDHADHRRLEQRARTRPGSRTVGGKGGNFALVGPDWKGTLPAGPDRTARADEPGDDRRTHVHRRHGRLRRRSCASGPVQVGAARLHGASTYTPPANVPLKAGVDTKTPVPTQVLAMSPEAFFNRLNRCWSTNPPEPADPDDDGAHRQARHRAGRDVQHGRVQPRGAQGDRGRRRRRAKACARAQRGKVVNGWQITLDMGRYGTNYPYRAGWTFFGVGGNLAEDAVYPFAERTATASRSTARTNTYCTSPRPRFRR